MGGKASGSTFPPLHLVPEKVYVVQGFTVYRAYKGQMLSTKSSAVPQSSPRAENIDVKSWLLINKLTAFIFPFPAKAEIVSHPENECIPINDFKKSRGDTSWFSFSISFLFTVSIHTILDFEPLPNFMCASGKKSLYERSRINTSVSYHCITVSL